MTRLATLALGALALAALVGLLRREDGQSPRARTGGPGARPASIVAVPSMAAPEPAATVVPAAVIQDPCQGVREALSSNDGPSIDASLDRLMGWVRGDARRALDVIALLSRETDPKLLDIVADALSQDPAIGDAREVVEAFLDMALRGALPAGRIAALTFLEERPRDPSMVETFLSIVSRDEDPDVRLAAVCAIRRQVDLIPERRVALNESLLRAATHGSAELRASVVEAVSLRDADDLQVSSVVGFLRDEDPMVRLTAAEKLGEAGPDQRVTALRALEEEYLLEKDARVLSMALAALVRAGGVDAVPALRRITGAHPTLDPVVSRLTARLSAGGVDAGAALDEAFGPDEAALPR